MTGRITERRPRLGRGLAVLPTSAGLLIDGSVRRRMISGAQPANRVGQLLTLLDGSRTTSQLANDTGFAHTDLDHVLGQLTGYQLLEWIDTSRPAGVEPHVCDFLSRLACALNSSAEDIAAALATSTAVVVDATMSGEMLEADLRELGIGTVERVGSPGELRKLRMATDRTIVVVHDRDHGLRRCQPHVPDGVPLLRYRVGTGDGEVGPLLHGSWTMCADCATAHDVAAGDPSYAAASVVVGVVSQEILGRLTGAVPVQRSGRIRRFDVTDMRLEILDAYPAADCPRCGRDWPAAAEVAAYEWTYQRSAPNAGLPRPPRSLDRMQRLDALRVLRNPLHSGPRTPLPPAARLRSVEPVGAGLTSTVLSDLLALTAGRRGADQATAVHRAHSRYAPSGGNIGSVALYAAVPEDIGRPANITKYDDIEHRLVAINRNRRRLSELLAETDLPDNGALAVIYLVGEVGRLGQKYEDFAIRLGHLDAGCAALQLSLVAQARGLRVTFASSWSADPGRCLELDDDTEVVTAIAAIHANRPVEKEAP